MKRTVDHTIRWGIALLLAVILAPGSSEAQDPVSEHGISCPSRCQSCKKTIQGALSYLAGKQSADGSIPVEGEKSGWYKGPGTIMTTSLAELGFLADGATPRAGTHRATVGKIRGYLEKRALALEFGKRQRSDVAALCLLFFVQLMEKESAKQPSQVIRTLVDFLSERIQQVMSGKMAVHGSTGSGELAKANITLHALDRARSVGVTLKPEVFEAAKSFYAKCLENNGSFKYDSHNSNPHEPRPGRCIAALLPLMAMGEDSKGPYAKAFEYARANLDKTMTHHTPQLHMVLGARTFHSLGEKDWGAFVNHYFKTLIARQARNGRLGSLRDYDSKLMMGKNDLFWGPTYATAAFAVLLQTARIGKAPDYDRAAKKAVSESKPLLVVFIDESSASEKLLAGLEDAAVGKLVKEKLVLVKLELARGDRTEVSKALKVRRAPAVVLVDPAQPRKSKQIVARTKKRKFPKSPEALAEFIRKGLASIKDSR